MISDAPEEAAYRMKVFKFLDGLPPGKWIRIADICKPGGEDKFIDTARLYIANMPKLTHEHSEDLKLIRRMAGWTAPREIHARKIKQP